MPCIEGHALQEIGKERAIEIKAEVMGITPEEFRKKITEEISDGFESIPEELKGMLREKLTSRGVEDMPDELKRILGLEGKDVSMLSSNSMVIDADSPEGAEITKTVVKALKAGKAKISKDKDKKKLIEQLEKAGGGD
jgi:lipoate-protein ligase A